MKANGPRPECFVNRDTKGVERIFTGPDTLKAGFTTCPDRARRSADHLYVKCSPSALFGTGARVEMALCLVRS